MVARDSTARLIDERGLRVCSVGADRRVRRSSACRPSADRAGGRADRRHQGGRACWRRSSASRQSRGSCCRCSTVSTTSPCCASASGPGTVRPGGRDPRRGRPARAGRHRAHEPVPAGSTWPAHDLSAARGDARRSRGCSTDAQIPARVLDSEAQVMWSKLVRLNALACTTSAYDKLLGEIRDRPAAARRADRGDRGGLRGGPRRGRAGRRPRGADRGAERAHATLGSSMQRDIAAGRPPELDAIPGVGAAGRRAARHRLPHH